MALGATEGEKEGQQPYVHPKVSKADRPLLADEPGCGELYDEHRGQAVHKAKHHVSVENIQQQQEKSQTYIREDWWKTRFVTPHPNVIDWKKIYRRVTENSSTGELVEDVRIGPGANPKDYQYKL